MKKTLVALLALSGITMAAEPITLTSTFKYDKTATTSHDYAFDVEGITLTKSVDGTSLNSKANTAGAQFTNSLRPDINVDSDADNSWTLDFTLANNTDELFTIDTITINAFTYTGGGYVQENNRNFLFTVTAGENTIATQQNLYVAGNKTSTTPFTINLTEALEIAAQNDLKFTIKVEQGAAGNGQARGSFIGVESIQFTGTIPEPTTATLSLLALAGLAARRRRK